MGPRSDFVKQNLGLTVKRAFFVLLDCSDLIRSILGCLMRRAVFEHGALLLLLLLHLLVC